MTEVIVLIAIFVGSPILVFFACYLEEQQYQRKKNRRRN